MHEQSAGSNYGSVICATPQQFAAMAVGGGRSRASPSPGCQRIILLPHITSAPTTPLAATCGIVRFTSEWQCDYQLPARLTHASRGNADAAAAAAQRFVITIREGEARTEGFTITPRDCDYSAAAVAIYTFRVRAPR